MKDIIVNLAKDVEQQRSHLGFAEVPLERFMSVNAVGGGVSGLRRIWRNDD